MEANPYAPPKAAVSDVASDSSTGLKRRSVVVMILLTIVTLGLYYPFWFFRRRAAINRLNSPRKLGLAAPVAFSLVAGTDVVVALITGDSTPAQLLGAGGTFGLTLVRLAVGIWMLVQCFIIRDIIQDHLTPEYDGQSSMFVEQVEISGVMTFFFGIYYLQHMINRYLVRPPSAETVS